MRPRRALVVILHNIRSLHNVGSIFRTAEAAGVAKIYFWGISPLPKDEFGRWRSQISKVALGAEKFIEWEKIGSTTNLIDRLKRERYLVIAVEQSKRSISLFELSKRNITHKKVALVLGNEIKGLSKRILDRSDLIVEIPVFGKKESLNVSIAFGIVVYHLLYLDIGN